MKKLANFTHGFYASGLVNMFVIPDTRDGQWAVQV